MLRLGINGFGRVGRMAFRAAAQRTDVEVVAVNDQLELPHLAYLLKYDSVHGRFGQVVQVPTSDVSVVDLTCQLRTPATWDEICGAMQRAAAGPLAGVLGYTEEALGSTDLRGEVCTSVFDANAGIQLDPTFVKLVAWYDNEWGYASKLLDLALAMQRDWTSAS